MSDYFNNFLAKDYKVKNEVIQGIKNLLGMGFGIPG